MQDADPAAHEAREIIERLQARFPEIGEERIRGTVTDAHGAFQGRPIRDFVPVFVERPAQETLSAPQPTPGTAH